MSIEVTCPECGISHRVNRNLAGRRVRCPQCDTTVHVPEIEAEAVAEPTDPDPDPDLDQDPNLDADPDLDPDHDVDWNLDSDGELAAAEPAGVAAEAVTAAWTEAADRDHSFDIDSADQGGFLNDSAIHLPQPQAVSSAEPIDTHIMVLDDEHDEDEVFQRPKRPAEEIDMTPMVDVTFLLLIFFMVTAAFSLQKSIQMPRQQTDAPSVNTEEVEDELDVVEVQVDEFGSFLVMAADWERETPGKQNLTTALREAIAGNNEGMKLDVKVHELAKLHALVDALDAGTIAGFSDLKVTQVEEFE